MAVARMYIACFLYFFFVCTISVKDQASISQWDDTDTAAQSAVSAADTKIFVYIPTAAPTYDVWEIMAI